MRYRMYIYKVRARLLLLMSAAILLAACSDDTDRSDSLSDDTDILQIATYTHDLTNPSASAATRAVTAPSGYSQYTGSASASIGVFMTPTEGTPTVGMKVITYENNAWHSTVKVTENTKYNIYGYMPAYVTCAIEPNTTFADGAILTFTDVPSVMSEDFCVITGVFDHEGDNNKSGTMKAGTFAYEGRNSDNFVSLMFDHLYGALNISLKVVDSYNSLRTIKLKELKLKTKVNGTPAKSKTTVTVTLNKTTDGTTPISDNGVIFASSGDDMDDVSFFQSATGKELGTEYESFIGHFMPEGITTFVVTSVYDVYDKKNNLVRKDCTAENILEISELYDRQTKTKRGSKYTIKLNIMPTYLYMLSEPDLDNPTVEVE